MNELVRKGGNQRGMALREVLAVLSIGVFLVFIATPALNRLQSGRSSAVCLNNIRQLGWAWQMYADENSGIFVGNFHGPTFLATSPRNAPWAMGWLDWTLSPANTNLLYIQTVKNARLTPYITARNNIYKCPADTYLSTAQRAVGWKERVRSVAMNMTMGDGNAVTGPWDGAMYRQAKGLADLTRPEPAASSVILEEHPDSINDPAFQVPRRTQFIDYPASYHQGGMNVNFADGHAETHIWRASARGIPIRHTGAGAIQIQPRVGDKDLSWLSFHSQRIRDQSY